jgi:hypothetical protein
MLKALDSSLRTTIKKCLGDHCVKRNKPGSERQVLCIFSHMQNPESRSKAKKMAIYINRELLE